MKWIKRSLLGLMAIMMSGLCLADGIDGDAYTRTKGNGSWGTLCLPRAITAVEGATLWVPYWCQKDDQSSWISPLYIRQIESSEFPIKAGTPVMFNYTSDTMKVTMTDDSKAKEIKTYMVGNLLADSITVPADNGNFILAWTWMNSKDHSKGGADEIREVTFGGVVKIPQYRAYLDLSNIPTSKPSEARENVIGWTLGGGIIDDPSGIVTIDEQESTSVPVMYDLNGRRANNASNGIVILDGKKIIKINE